jgi:AraC family transcriptional regulator
MWLYESRPVAGQTCFFTQAPSKRLPQTHIALLGPESAVKVPGHTLALVIVITGRCCIETTAGSFDLRARHFMACARETAPFIHIRGRGLALVLGFSDAALRRLTPNIGSEPLPGSGQLDTKTLRSVCTALRNAEAPTAQFWRREPELRSLLHRINLLQADLLERMIACPGKSRSHKLQVMARMQRARLYLEANADRYVRIPELAMIASYSPCYFTRTFQRIYGLSPKACAMRFRLERVHRLLREQPGNISEIARSCGFENQSHFAHAFRQHFGVPPTWARDDRYAV